MGKGKKNLPAVSSEVSASNPVISTPDFSNIIGNENLSASEKRRAAWELMGVRQPRQRYASKEERKAASKARAKERRAKKLALLPEELRPKPRGPKMTVEEKRQKRSERTKNKRQTYHDVLREVNKTNPGLLKQYGININRFRV